MFFQVHPLERLFNLNIIINIYMITTLLLLLLILRGSRRAKKNVNHQTKYPFDILPRAFHPHRPLREHIASGKITPPPLRLRCPKTRTARSRRNKNWLISFGFFLRPKNSPNLYVFSVEFRRLPVLESRDQKRANFFIDFSSGIPIFQLVFILFPPAEKFFHCR